jgi:hypothetical protein
VKVILAAALFLIALGVSTAEATGVVALAGYHKMETKHTGHYRWESSDLGGYSELAGIIHDLGAEVRTISEPLNEGNLKGVTVLLIVAPDTRATTTTPNFISEPESLAVDGWVRNGGHLLLFGNNKGHSEFQQLNRLAAKFGVEFIESTFRDVNGRDDFHPLSVSPQLGVGLYGFISGAAPLRISNPEAEVLMRDVDSAIMVQVLHGKGTVIALGDPWLYNEHITDFDNWHLGTNLFYALMGGGQDEASHDGRLNGAPQTVGVDLSNVAPGAVRVSSTGKSVIVQWPDEADQQWTAEFSLDSYKPLVTAISVHGTPVVRGGRPDYELTAGRRIGGWNVFFDDPAANLGGLRTFQSQFVLKSVRATTIGDRVEVSFDGLYLGPFTGSVRYMFFPKSRLIEQAAVVSTNEHDTAYIYNAGLSMVVASPPRISYYDTEGRLQDTALAEPTASHPLAVRYRTLAGRSGSGSVAVFPAPHRYFYPRDSTLNQGYVSVAAHRDYEGESGDILSMGIHQYHDQTAGSAPLMNAPPGTEQRMSLFLLPTLGSPEEALEDVTKFTHRDHFQAIDGYSTFTSHYHFAYTVKAIEKGFDWSPPFKAVLESMGVQSVMLMDFHGDGHPNDPGEIRLREERAYYEGCRRQSDANFLMIPGEEVDNVLFGGHWGLAFPKPTYWHMSRAASRPFEENDPKYGTVYNVADKQDMLRVVRKEDAFVYQTHPRTKGSTGYPDRAKDEAYFRDPHYVGAGWKALPSDLSSPRLGDRAFTLLDDMSNWGLKKRILGEVDVFDIDPTHELYAHMNINYVRTQRLPSFDDYGKLLDSVRRGDFFVSTGEVLLRDVKITPRAGGRFGVDARITYTFPLQMAEVTWGDGFKTYRMEIPLTETHPFGDLQFSTEVEGGDWKWARLSTWDIAADGAFVNPVWREE